MMTRKWWREEGRRLREWWRQREGLMAVTILAAGVFALGFAIASIRAELMLSQQTKRFAAVRQELADAYRESLASKDETIAALSAHTAKAADRADDAARAAAEAAEQSATAADAGCVKEH